MEAMRGGVLRMGGDQSQRDDATAGARRHQGLRTLRGLGGIAARHGMAAGAQQAHLGQAIPPDLYPGVPAGVRLRRAVQALLQCLHVLRRRYGEWRADADRQCCQLKRVGLAIQPLFPAGRDHEIRKRVARLLACLALHRRQGCHRQGFVGRAKTASQRQQGVRAHSHEQHGHRGVHGGGVLRHGARSTLGRFHLAFQHKGALLAGRQ